MTTKIVLITGASTGFGRDVTETLARTGHAVLASMRDIAGKNRGHAETLRRVASAEALSITPIELDVTSDVSVERAVAKVLRDAGRIDVVVNNAGVALAGVSETFTVVQVRDLFEVNVLGVHRVMRAVLPTLRQQHDGLVINVGSILGRVTFPFFGLYGATKFAVEAMTESYRYELSQLGVEIVLVQPSAYPTPMYTNAAPPMDPGRASEYGRVAQIPGQLLGTFMAMFQGPNAPNPHEVAEAIARLVAQPKGSRPARTIVGSPFGADLVNGQTAPVQAQVVERLGLGHLDSVSCQTAA